MNARFRACGPSGFTVKTNHVPAGGACSPRAVNGSLIRRLYGKKTEDTGLTRRDFVKTLGLTGLALGTGVHWGPCRPEPPAGAAKAASIPRRTLGKTGVDVSMLAWAAC